MRERIKYIEIIKDFYFKICTCTNFCHKYKSKEN